MLQEKERLLLLVAQLKMVPKPVRMTTALDALMSFYLDMGRQQGRSDDGPMNAAFAFAAVRKAIAAADLSDQFGEALDDILGTLRAISDEPDTEGVD